MTRCSAFRFVCVSISIFTIDATTAATTTATTAATTAATAAAAIDDDPVDSDAGLLSLYNTIIYVVVIACHCHISFVVVEVVLIVCPYLLYVELYDYYHLLSYLNLKNICQLKF